jgi:hypothetical protein
MAKELPYFKFEPNQWENGNVQMCSREDKGLFVDLCSMYWSRLGDLPLKLAIQKLCAGNATALNSLCDDRIIAVDSGFIRIDFLEEQLSEFDNTSKQNSKNAKDGWDKRRAIKALSESNATASKPQCENDAIREEKIREEESININMIECNDVKIFKEINKPIFLKPDVLEIKQYCFSRGNNIDAEKFFDFYESKGWLIGKSKMKDWRASVRTWERSTINNKKSKEENFDQLLELTNSIRNQQ